jgi:RNA polymerase sigma-70 factor (ECF subfamily)
VAWERFVRHHQEDAYRVAYLICRSMPLAEAATEAAFVRAYRALPTLAPGLALRPWLLRLVAAEARQKRRVAGRPRTSSRPDEPRHQPRIPATPLPGSEAAEALTAPQRDDLVTAFERLSEDDRLLIAARYLLDMSPADAAATLAISEATVADRLRSALRHLRARLGTDR